MGKVLKDELETEVLQDLVGHPEKRADQVLRGKLEKQDHREDRVNKGLQESVENLE